MSTYKQWTKHPATGLWEHATWMDDYFGRHHYGVSFPSDGDKVFDPYEQRLTTGELTDREAALLNEMHTRETR